MSRELVQVRDENGVTQWARSDTGEITTRNPIPSWQIKSSARAYLAELEPKLYDLLERGTPLNWYELGRVIDVLMKATTVDAAKGLINAKGLKEIQRCVTIMLQAQALAKRLDPLSGQADPNAKRGETQKLASALLTLPT